LKTLETERLILRKFAEEDLEDLFEYAQSLHVGPNAGWPPHKTKEDSATILKMFIEEGEVWAIVERKSNKVIGSYGLHNDKKRDNSIAKMIGYVLSDKFWGNGYMPEATNRVLEYAFNELDLNIVSVYHFPFNERSKRVIEKCGFKFEGVLRLASTLPSSEIVDDVCYSMTKEEFLKKII
jgi:putative acetyltransferase